MDDASAGESSGAVTFTLTLTEAASAPVSVRATTGPPATALEGTDYTPFDAIVTFPAGDTTATVIVPVIDEALGEADETFTLTLSEPNGLALGDATATGTIVNDDCTDDGFEDNDTQQTARSFGRLNPTVTIGARLCRDDEDWFAVWSGPSMVGTQTLDVEFTAATAIKLQVTRSDGATFHREGTNGSFTVVVDADSRVLMRVLQSTPPELQGSPCTVKITQR